MGIGLHEVLLPDNHNHHNLPNLNHYNYLAESLFKVANSSILENPQFGKVSGCCCGYCDKLWNWWIKLGDWLMQLSDYSQLSDFNVRFQPYTIISEK